MSTYHLCRDGKQKPGHREDCLSCNPAKRASRESAIIMEQAARIVELKSRIAQLEAQLAAKEAEAS